MRATIVRAMLLLCCAAAAAARAEVQLLQPWSTSGGTLAPPWHLAGLPNQKKPFTRFVLVEHDGRRAMRIEADSSYGNLVHPLRIDGTALTLSWSWRVDEFVAESDLRIKNGDDTAVKVCVFFDLALEQIGIVERQIMRIARAASHEPLPAATVCYVWDRLLPAGTMLDNAFTHRVRYLVLQTGEAKARRWVDERRDVGADFLRLFGQESTQVPAIVGVAIGADADNTHGHSIAHVADLVLAP
ncbi:MAG: DUF3047 domain-containing protein [Piscinibacter sp.]